MYYNQKSLFLLRRGTLPFWYQSPVNHSVPLETQPGLFFLWIYSC